MYRRNLGEVRVRVQLGNQNGRNGKRLGRFPLSIETRAEISVHSPVQREANQYIYYQCPGLADKLSMDDFVAERNRKQNELFAKVQPMEGAVEVVKHLVSSRLCARWVEVDNVCVA